MFCIRHRFDSSLLVWTFQCTSEMSVAGRERSCSASREAAEHAVRQLLSRERGQPVSVDEVRRVVSHVYIGPIPAVTGTEAQSHALAVAPARQHAAAA